MEKKTDLRVVKTKRRIKEVFNELLIKKDVKKISVTELSRMAEINKGTFYLHYKDIYELYAEVLQDKVNEIVNGITFFNEFFDAPQDFIYHLAQYGKHHLRPEDYPVFQSGNFIYVQMIPELMTEALRNKIYEQGSIERTEDNNIRLNYILFSLYHFLQDEHPDKKYPIVSKLIVGDIRAAFPDVVKK